MSSPLRLAIQLPAPPPMEPRAFSGPRLAPPISDTKETAAIPGTSPTSTCPVCRSSNRPGVSQGRRVRRRTRPTATPAATATATHHQCPPNQPGWESLYHLLPSLIAPTNIRPAKAPKIPRITAQAIRTQNSRFWVTGGAVAGRDGAVTTGNARSCLTNSLATRCYQPGTHPSFKCWGYWSANTSPVPDDRWGSGSRGRAHWLGSCGDPTGDRLSGGLGPAGQARLAHRY